MFVEPAVAPVTTPVLLTVATDVAEDAQVIVLPVAFPPVIVAVSAIVLREVLVGIHT
jgi:hypothetical protein